jgi:hypothetical protein
MSYKDSDVRLEGFVKEKFLLPLRKGCTKCVQWNMGFEYKPKIYCRTEEYN